MEVKTKTLSALQVRVFNQLWKQIVLRTPAISNWNFMLQGKGIQEMSQFTYLGSNVQTNGEVQKEMSQIGKAIAAFTNLNKISHQKATV